MAHVAAQLADKVRSLRAGLDLTQEEAAERASLEAKHWQLVEAGGTNPTLATLLSIAKALEVQVHELLHFKAPRQRVRRST